MAAPHALAWAPVLSVALTVAGPPRILTAFHVPGTCHGYEYLETPRVVKIEDVRPGTGKFPIWHP